MTIQSWEAFKYMEVFEITEWKGGAIYKTKTTGKYIEVERVSELDPKKFTTAPMSTRLMRQEKIEIDLY